WSCSDFNSYFRCSSNFNLRSLDNKKPQHPAGVSHIGLLGMTPVLPHAPGAIFLILVVWNILFSMTSS
ncbi:hypothetical protein, partial [Acinetobacter indicus]|uniref:hypothetical protein n=1 Tax=Acinetobacter indicus TaxID=756892 RepID=UPI001C089E0D